MTTMISKQLDGIDPRSGVRLRFRGSVGSLSPEDRRALFDRAVVADNEVRPRTAGIIDRVRRGGDDALLALARELDGATLDRLEVPRAALRQALDTIDSDLRRALDRAAKNIANVHRAFLPQTVETSPERGIIVGRRADPLNSVGVYAPGGRAAYASSVLMCAIPARIAGVREVIICTPPGRDGLPASVVLAAAALAEVDNVFAIGGAGAIAAMAFGTPSVPRVDRIVGPGNAYVTEAKLQLSGVVGIDSPAGPSELLIIADSTSNAEVVACELLAQAEHDPLTCVVAVVIGEASAAAIELAIARHIESAPRRDIVERALTSRGGVVTVESLSEAVDVANRYAPEHLLVALASSERCADVLGRLRNAGTVFVGETSSNVFGDYITGANHVLPTLGLARSYSGLSVQDFLRWTTYQHVDRAAAASLALDVVTLANAEGLPGHARAANAWADKRTTYRTAVTLMCETLLPVRQEVARLSTYSDGRETFPDSPPGEEGAITLDLSDNTNLWGCPPSVLSTLGESSKLVARYPSPFSSALKRAISDYLCLTNAGVVVGCGSDDIIDSTMRAFGNPGTHIAYSTPTFSMIPVFAQLNGLFPVEVPLLGRDDQYDVNVERLIDTGAKIIYLCAPNNPTGTPVSRAALEWIVDSAPGIVILDEAYAEFAGLTNVDLTERSERVIVTRTFSKAFGLAGLRVGYGVAATRLIDLVERARGPYKVTAVAERAAISALQDVPEGLGWVRDHSRLAAEMRERFRTELLALGFEVFPSRANFVLAPHIDARDIAAQLRAAGVLVRIMTGLSQELAPLANAGGNALRISAGPWDAMKRVLQLLAEAVS